MSYNDVTYVYIRLLRTYVSYLDLAINSAAIYCIAVSSPQKPYLFPLIVDSTIYTMGLLPDT